jgi:hypothetical protein
MTTTTKRNAAAAARDGCAPKPGSPVKLLHDA